MELTISISALCLCLFYLAASVTTAVNIVVTCTKTNDLTPDEWSTPPQSNPSPLHDLNVLLTPLNGTASLALNIAWSINVDSSVYSISGTWIEVNTDVRYRCKYQPPFTSDQAHIGDLDQLWFNFTTTDVNIDPSDLYEVTVYNLPPAPPNVRNNYLKWKMIHAPGCDHELMRDHSACLKKQQEPSIPTKGKKQSTQDNWDITTVWIKDEIQVKFSPLLGTKKYEILLRRETNILNYTEVKANGEFEELKANLKFSGPCENLKIWITPVYDHCGYICKSECHNIDCREPSTAAPTEEPKENQTCVILICIGCAAVIILLIIWQFWMRKRFDYSKSGLDSAGSVGVLVVYPAVDSVFQSAVMAIAEFLQCHRELKVIIDMWQRGSLAGQGTLRWLNSQVICADKVLIILPPQKNESSNDTACLISNKECVIADYTVPASACELFSLALNLVASCAHDPQQLQKFLVVHLDIDGHRSTTPVELRGCKALILPRELEKLHQLFSTQKNISGCRFKSCRCKEPAKKVRDAVQNLDRRNLMK
ncbi:interleukin-17 receptor B isoform 1-T1 [Clarias gariepinus]|uniref:interleukin-17 receptor B n=1 Tax=Clarias gariepinus TaxID=13013 RepID=UPI00234D7B78|nr:interleukin-17 receptor B [Clarias gariepinus]